MLGIQFSDEQALQCYYGKLETPIIEINIKTIFACLILVTWQAELVVDVLLMASWMMDFHAEQKFIWQCFCLVGLGDFNGRTLRSILSFISRQVICLKVLIRLDWMSQDWITGVDGTRLDSWGQMKGDDCRCPNPQAHSSSCAKQLKEQKLARQAVP